MELQIRSDQMQDVSDVTAQYPYALHRADSRSLRVPWHWHEEVEFSYVRRGTLRVTVSGRNLLLRPGEGLFLNTNVLHAMEPAEAGQAVLWDSHMVHPALLGGLYKSVFDTKYLAPVLKNRLCPAIVFREDQPRPREILALLRAAADAQEQAFSEFRTRNLFSDLWLLLMQEVEALAQTARPQTSAGQERIQSMLTFIHGHYAEKLTLEQIAAAAMVSKRECLRCFQSCIQKSPFAYLLDYRVQMAERLLRTTDLPVTEIALQTGFSDSAYFARTFRTLRGVSPTQFRRG